jgi:hypothetical protein
MDRRPTMAKINSRAADQQRNREIGEIGEIGDEIGDSQKRRDKPAWSRE